MGAKKVKLKELLIILRNGANIKQFEDAKGLPITRIETISDATINSTKVGYANIFDDKYQDYYLKEGDILLSHINSIAHLGKCAIYDNPAGRLIHGMNLLMLRANKESVLPKYLYYVLNSKQFKIQLPKITKKSVNQASMTVTDIGNLNLIIEDDINQQQKIVDILDKADEIRQKKKLANDKLDEFLKSTFIDMFGDPVKNEKKLPIRTIGECIDINPSKPALNDNCIVTFLGMKDISEEGKVYLEDEKEYKDVKTGFTSFINEDVLLAKITPCFENGKSAIARNLKNGYGFGSTEFHVLRPKKDILLPECLYQTIHSSSFIKAGTMKMSGAVGQKRIPKVFIQSYKIAVPSIEEQNKFAQIVEKVEAQKQKNEQVIEQMNNLFNSLSQQAFKGEL